jgi:hypothetical protein
MGKAGSSILNKSGLDNMSKDLIAGKRQDPPINSSSIVATSLKVEDPFNDNRNAGFRANSVTAIAAKDDQAFT